MNNFFLHGRAPVRSNLVWCSLLAAFLALLCWDYSGLDLVMARWFGGPGGFALHDHWLWSAVLHDDIRPLTWLLELFLLINIWRPMGSITQLGMERRLQLALTTLLALLLVSGIKLHSRSSCPWDLREFGGSALYVSHWAWGVFDGGGGSCFPAGHASAGFAFIGGFFAFRHQLPDVARRWLWAAMTAGLVLGLAQQVRGAHFMSHTLWTAWFCWLTAALVDALVSRSMSQRPSPAQAQVPGFVALQPSLQSVWRD